jgi:hypothetical protein
MRSERFYAENFRSQPGKMIAFVVYETGEVTAALADRASPFAVRVFFRACIHRSGCCPGKVYWRAQARIELGVTH